MALKRACGIGYQRSVDQESGSRVFCMLVSRSDGVSEQCFTVSLTEWLMCMHKDNELVCNECVDSVCGTRDAIGYRDGSAALYHNGFALYSLLALQTYIDD